MLLRYFLIIFLLFSYKANAYLVSAFNSSAIDYEKVTHVLVAGTGEDLGTQFQEVARGKAIKYQQHYPQDQIVLISAKEPDIDNVQMLSNWGLKLIKDDRSTFNGKAFIDEVKKFKKIASIDIFSHSSAQYGIHLESKVHRLTTNSEGLEKIKGHFNKGAYIILHGCNAGFNLAPFLSALWEVPVAGAMTSTNFQRLHSNEDFYLSEAGLFPEGPWAMINELSFELPVNCKPGLCIRLKPDNTPYVGFWGAYREGGLPFYKFFCSKNTDRECRETMARSLLGFVATTHLKKTSSFIEYKKTVWDFLCPVSSTRNLRQECIDNLEGSLQTGDETYNPFSRRQIQCDFQTCQVEIKCEKIFMTGAFKPGTCSLINKFEGKATTLIKEYKAYLEGFSGLNN